MRHATQGSGLDQPQQVGRSVASVAVAVASCKIINFKFGTKVPMKSGPKSLLSTILCEVGTILRLLP